MFRLSKMADYGTVVMAYLARLNGEHHNATEVAEATKLSVPTVRKLLKQLAHAGLVTSQLGTKGGYSLARPAQQISVADVIEALEQFPGLTECTHTHQQCAIEHVCSIRGHWRVIDQAIQTALGSVSLADLAKPRISEARVDTRRIRALGGENHGKNR